MFRTAAFLLLIAPLLAYGQAYPSRVIRVIVPYAAGGSLDSVTRAMVHKMSESIGQPIVVDNRPGATGIVGSEVTARAAPDGYTVLVQPVTHYMVQFFAKNVPYDPVKDFTPIGFMGVSPAVLIVSASLPVQNVNELIAYARKNPGKLDYGTTGIGSMQHLGGLMLSQVAGIKMEHVPYKGGAPAMADLLSGQIAMAFLSASTAMPQAKSGKVRPLGVIERQRFRTVPGVPAVAESLSGYGVPDTWYGMLGPAGLPEPIVARLNSEIRKAMAAPEVVSRLDGMGFEVKTGTTEEFVTAILKDIEIIQRIITAAGLKPE
jgi:tripartite-type tricarboxylate transporter receptor subunit TctC